MRDVPFVTVDVFTDTRFAGNPLAVILDARALSDGDMQRIATEFGYSETTFVLPPRNPVNTAEIRIFTPVTEVPFAGHPNVGTAFALGSLGEIFGRPTGSTMRFEEKAGLVEVALILNGTDVTGATIRAPSPLHVGSTVSPVELAPCASLTPAEIVTKHHTPVFASVGLKFVLAEVKDLEALGRAAPKIEPLAILHDVYTHEQSDCAIFLYTWFGTDHVRARMFAPLDNVPEDPATGSASAALGAYLSTLGGTALSRRLLVEQGVEMGRRSLIEVNVTACDGTLEAVTVAGSCIEVMRGEIRL
ncbi:MULTISPECIES: PhzF family phenazine biosynthesis protein [Alphaproteobacteria]|uniref:Trans-2,3-dihydro-3-hydroxyanthranilate isomerase n=2 Tax=Alphaproteobacteria TaxID=28211 RepID=A0A512HPL9_9HYPH|nr:MULTISPECIES: PhzF family phenazine biosynthesis protein [Alphaproteobacteria]GEO87403.1 hypothetical protein RNA01_43350 [Ciceribacter naphthalenivorans]GLR23753.1 hypothetical protein GCM10007920_35450 [Ciceribacter naphthalenivorans]GLT06609.1 hypothetical protein GCM10007926_35450 [Sphingomonas psychrolutea]